MANHSGTTAAPPATIGEQDELVRRLQADLAAAQRAASVHQEKAKLLQEANMQLEGKVKSLSDQAAQLESLNQHLSQLGQTWEEKAKRSEERNNTLRSELEKSKASFAQKIVRGLFELRVSLFGVLTPRKYRSGRSTSPKTWHQSWRH
jgi:DNA anti-recombination protein RmuC